MSKSNSQSQSPSEIKNPTPPKAQKLVKGTKKQQAPKPCFPIYLG